MPTVRIRDFHFAAMVTASSRAGEQKSDAREGRKGNDQLPGQMQSCRTAVDLALTAEGHVRRHVVRLALESERESIVAHLEGGDLVAVDLAESSGFHVLKGSRGTPSSGRSSTARSSVFATRTRPSCSTSCAATPGPGAPRACATRGSPVTHSTSSIARP